MLLAVAAIIQVLQEQLVLKMSIATHVTTIAQCITVVFFCITMITVYFLF